MSGPEQEPAALIGPGQLARAGFADIPAAVRTLASPALGAVSGADLVAWAAGAADPDVALAGLAAFGQGVGAAPLAALLADGQAGTRLVAVLGASAALGEHLARHPGAAFALAAPSAVDPRAALLAAVGADPADLSPVADDPVAAPDRLRVAYRDLLTALAADDLTGVRGVAGTAERLADLAAAALEAALAVARAALPAAAAAARLAVIGLGKTGGRELNYVSDVDVVFVAEAAPGVDEREGLAAATRLAGELIRVCGEPGEAPALWQVDVGLRPEGRSGALVRTLASHLAYYERWAATWEFQALLKARPVAGDPALGAAYCDGVAPLVWAAAGRESFVDDVRAMRQRVLAHVPAERAERELKLGPGGMRDVEFAVQLLQLVHGRSDIFVRSPTTLTALEQLSTLGYVGRADAAELDRAYRFLRTVEHRVQLFALRRTHLMPTTDVDLRRVARSMGMRRDPVAELTEQRHRQAVAVRRLHEKLFYRPLLAAVVRLDPGEARLTPAAARDRLVALGYVDPDGALRQLRALTDGMSRRAAIQRTLLPVLLGWFAEGPDPDAGLRGFRAVSDALGASHWYLGMLRDGGAAAQRLARVLSSSRYATDLLLRAPEGVALLGEADGLVPPPAAAVRAQAAAAAATADEPAAAVSSIRAVRRRELFRVASADVLGELDLAGVGEALSAVAEASVAAGLDVATRVVTDARDRPAAARLAVLALGRFGGRELGYGSDADVLFVYEPVGGADDAVATEDAHALANTLRALLGEPGVDPPLDLDAGLRPEGRSGPLVRSVESMLAYYERWSAPWEAQALLRAAPMAGDPGVAEAFLAGVADVRYPPGGLDAAALREVRRIKARVEAERLPRGADPATHLKLGRGGLADVEWTVQLLQLQHGAQLPALRTTATLAALDAAAGEGLLAPGDAAALADAWTLASRVRNATVLVRGRAADSLPVDVAERTAVARLLGYAPGRTADLLEDYRRTARRARAVVERTFFA